MIETPSKKNPSLPLSQDALKELSNHFLEGIGRIIRLRYGDDLVSVAAYGSVARGDLHEDSDLDLLLVVNGLPQGRWARLERWNEVEQDVENSYQHLREQGWNWSLSPVIKTPDEVEMGSPLFLDMTEDCIVLEDRGAFLSDYLVGLKRRLDEQGARRIWQGRTWYWDLQPDFDPAKKIHL